MEGVGSPHYMTMGALRDARDVTLVALVTSVLISLMSFAASCPAAHAP
jgi:hypothetical protein